MRLNWNVFGSRISFLGAKECERGLIVRRKVLAEADSFIELLPFQFVLLDTYLLATRDRRLLTFW